jgi:hypothetical protein
VSHGSNLMPSAVGLQPSASGLQLESTFYR